MAPSSSDHRLMLRPGFATVRRDAGHVQVGVDRPARAVLADTPSLSALLESLPGVPHDGAAPALRSLRAADLLVDADELAAHRAVSGRALTEATYAAHGSGAHARLDARSAATVAVVTRGSVEAAAVAALLRGSGLDPTHGADALPSVCLVVSDRPTPRAQLDPLVRDHVPHLLVEVNAGRVRVGPFVEPGVTACTRCVDAHLGEPDPRRALVIEQLAAGAHPEPVVDPTTLALALAWAAHDVVAFVDGEAPSTWSATLDLVPGTAPVARTWQRHPHCGCCWDAIS